MNKKVAEVLKIAEQFGWGIVNFAIDALFAKQDGNKELAEYYMRKVKENVEKFKKMCREEIQTIDKAKLEKVIRAAEEVEKFISKEL